MDAPSNPHTLPEWQAYIATLVGDDLRSKAIAANGVTFVRMLEADGLTPQEVKAVFQFFAERLVAEGQEPPASYNAILHPAVLNVAFEGE